MQELDTAFIQVIEEARIKLKKLQDEECSKGNHGFYLKFTGFGGGFLHWRCTHCGTISSQPDLPMTI